MKEGGIFMKPDLIQTIYYSILWVFMMIIGILMYEQPLIQKRHNKILAALRQIGWMIIFIAMLGCVHGILAYFKLIIPL